MPRHRPRPAPPPPDLPAPDLPAPDLPAPDLRAQQSASGPRWPLVLQLLVLAVVTVTAAAVIDQRTAQVAADVAADEGLGPRVVLAERVVRAAAPVSVEIPGLGVRSTLIDLRRQPDGTLEVPRDPQRAGWYVDSSHPGDPGPTVIAGHVDSRSGPGVFFHLDRLRPGDLVLVRRADRSVARFVVTHSLRVAKRSFPTALVYQGSRDPSLRLISCGGDFDRSTGHYLDNVIVLAVPVAPPPSRHGQLRP